MKQLEEQNGRLKEALVRWAGTSADAPVIIRVLLLNTSSLASLRQDA